MKTKIFTALLVAFSVSIQAESIQADELEEIDMFELEYQSDSTSTGVEKQTSDRAKAQEEEILIDAMVLEDRGASISTTENSAFPLQVSDEGQSSLEEFKGRLLTRLPFVQYYQRDDGTVIKAAQSEGWGIEIGAGYAYTLGNAWSDGSHTPIVELSPRYDARWISLRAEISVLMRERHKEDVNPGAPYMAFAGDVVFHVNLWNDQLPFNEGFNNHVVSLYGSVGYLFDQHRTEVGTLIDADKNLYQLVEEHRASGMTYGFGLEYQWRIHARGNGLIFRLGAKNIPQSFVEHTERQWQLSASVAFNIGINRNRFAED